LLARGHARFDVLLARAAPERESAPSVLGSRAEPRALSGWLALVVGVALLAMLAFSTLDAVLPVRAP
jgi:hypothetical protein